MSSRRSLSTPILLAIAMFILLAVLTTAVLATAVISAAAGVPMTACLLIATLAPVVSVVGFEVVGHRHAAAAIAASVSDHR